MYGEDDEMEERRVMGFVLYLAREREREINGRIGSSSSSICYVMVPRLCSEREYVSVCLYRTVKLGPFKTNP